MKLLRWGMPVRQGVLNLGCGSNLLAEELSEWVGVETKLKRLRRLAHSHSKLVQSAPEALPFADGSFDGLVCAGVLEHWPKSEGTMTELVRVLRPGGWLCVSVPDSGRRLWAMVEWAHRTFFPEVYGSKMTSHYTTQELVGSIESAGAEVLGVRTVYGAEAVIAARKKE